MKILTVCITGVKEENNICNLIDSCLLIRDEIEVLVLDSYGVHEEIQAYSNKYPENVKIIDVGNQYVLSEGIKQASGLYFKLVNADNRLDTATLVKVVETLKDLMRVQSNLDMMICDYEYPKNRKKNYKIEYENVFPLDKVFQWHQTKGFKSIQLLRTEAIVLKTNILKKMDLSQMDMQYGNNIMLIQVLSRVKSMYYLDQSLECIMHIMGNKEYFSSFDNYEAMIKHIISHIDINVIESRKLRNCITNQIHNLLLRYSILCHQQNCLDFILREEELMEYIQIENPYAYKQLKKIISSKIYTSKMLLSKKLIFTKYKNMK